MVLNRGNLEVKQKPSSVRRNDDEIQCMCENELINIYDEGRETVGLMNETVSARKQKPRGN